MPEFDKPHIDISARVNRTQYQAPRQNIGGGGAPRIRAEHGAMIEAQFEAAFREADENRPEDDRVGAAEGVYIEVDLRRGSNPEKVLQRKRDGVLPGAAKPQENGDLRIALYVPDEARPVLEEIVRDYREGNLNNNGAAPNHKKIEPIEAIRRARLETFWTDNAEAMPQGAQDTIWWEVWCFPGMDNRVADAAGRLGCLIAEAHYWLSFPEAVVIPVKTTRATIELLLFATAGVSELRRASTTPAFFLEQDAEEQLQWTEDLAERVRWPAGDAPAVCLLDTGVNRAHMLIEPSLSAADLLMINPDWGGDDHDGHGTGMAGLALFGDLTPRLEDAAEIDLSHRLESVKIVPPNGFPANQPESYGSITQSSVAISEINNSERDRFFCLAVTNENVSGSRATTWSAAIDQAAIGKMAGDENDAPRRLFVISAGNAPPEIDPANILDADELPVEDPAQAWNALTVGGYTNKTVIGDVGYEDWTPLRAAGDISPFTRTSVTWPQGRAPIKPDIVMEAGNRASSPLGTEVLSLDSLAPLSTGDDVATHPLVPFAATSAAAAQAARLAAQISAAHPGLWPETIRALVVHSAEWTPHMKAQLLAANGKTAKYPLLRRFGHGVPDFARASASATNHLALIAENEIQPFRMVRDENGKRHKKFGDCHYYKLPWSTDVLEGLGEQDVRLKLTLSYFIEPNPGRFAAIDPQRYQSFGLRFDLKRRAETEQNFVERVNALERDDPLAGGPDGGDNSGWMFGPNSISSGSLHCDEWVGPAVQLAARNVVCVKPVTGWWKDSAKNCSRTGRYSMVLTLSSPDMVVDLHTPIQTSVEAGIGVEIAV